MGREDDDSRETRETGFRVERGNRDFGVTTRIRFRARAGFRVQVKKPFVETDTIKRGLGFRVCETDTIQTRRSDVQEYGKKMTHAGTRTPNPQIRSLVRCPLRHAGISHFRTPI